MDSGNLIKARIFAELVAFDNNSSHIRSMLHVQENHTLCSSILEEIVLPYFHCALVVDNGNGRPQLIFRFDTISRVVIIISVVDVVLSKLGRDRTRREAWSNSVEVRFSY